MSFARFGEYDVYLFPTRCDDGTTVWECCGCALHPHPFGSHRFALLSDFLAHVDEHRAAGLHVPDAETLRARCVEYAEATRDAEDGK